MDANAAVDQADGRRQCRRASDNFNAGQACGNDRIEIPTNILPWCHRAPARKASPRAIIPDASSGTGTSSETKAELERTKEALTSREQEAGELKSRVKQLEDLNGKDQRLISLKESEIADLQNKLKELQSGKATSGTSAPPPVATQLPVKPPETPATPATKPADTTAKGDAKLTAKDIWGDISAGDKTAAAKPAAPSSTPPVVATPAVTPTPSSGSSSPTTAATTPPPVTPATPAVTEPTPTATPPPTSATPPAGTSASTTPVTSPATTPPADLSATPPVPAPVKPATPKPTPKPVVAPSSTEPEWYQNNTALLAGGLGLLLIGGLALMRFMRKPKAVLVPTEPMSDADAHIVSEDEQHLLDALAQHPGDSALSLELLSLYYSQHEAAKFEAAAEAMHAHIVDPAARNGRRCWRWAKNCARTIRCSAVSQTGHEDASLMPHDRSGRIRSSFGGPMSTATTTHSMTGRPRRNAVIPPADERFDFDLTDHAAEAAADAPVHDADIPITVRTLVDIRDGPPWNSTLSPPRAASTQPADELFAGEDAIGTKLDLAKAYLDMGDPEGARSMLDEVMSEGNDLQKDEARKLLAEIR